ncbi:MAG: aldo/keto reductase [Pseudohongiellaceae bacterium]
MLEKISVGKSKMPSVGLGLWKLDQPETADIIVNGVKSGYRHLDSAADYGNEIQVGEGIKQSLSQGICRREDLWVTSKLWNTFHRPEHVLPACEKSLRDLSTDYIDLYLIHFPISLKYVAFDKRYPPEWIYDPTAENPRMHIDPVPLSETWHAMEGLVERGLVKEIGVCNYNSSLLHDLMAYASIKPAMLQIESHPFLTQEKLIKTAKNYGIAVTCFSPLGALSYMELEMADQNESVLNENAVKVAAERLDRTPAQVVLRWGLQRGTAVIPKTSKKERLIENQSLFDFELSNQEMSDISNLNVDRRFNDPGVFCESAFNTFFPIYD